MESKQEQQQQQQQQQVGSDTAKEINIDINGEAADRNSLGANQVVGSSTMKNMSADDNARVGLTKDELMRYANEPFWIRLRNILFASFWIVWVSILIAAITYVVKSPGCSGVSASSVPAMNSTTPTGK